MLANEGWKKAVLKRSIRHFSPTAIINVFLLFALIITSCVPLQKATPVAEQTTDESTVVRQLPTPEDYKTPVYERPESRTADRADLNAPATSALPETGNSISSPLIENPSQFDPEEYIQTMEQEFAARLEKLENTIPPNPVRAVEPSRKSISDNGVFTVTTLTDKDDGVCDRDCSLREAIYAANDEPGANTITFGVSGRIILDSTLPYSTDPSGLTIDGQNVTIGRRPGGGVRYVVAKHNSGLAQSDPEGCDFNVEGPLTISISGTGCAIQAKGALTILDSTLTDASILGWTTVEVTNSSFSGDSAIASYGTLLVETSSFAGYSSLYSKSAQTITDSPFSDESAIFSFGTLAIANSSLTASSVASAEAHTITNCTFSEASWVYSSTTLAIENSSFTGGRVLSFGAMTSAGNVSFDHVTVVSEESVTISNGNAVLSNSTLIGDLNNHGALTSKNSTVVRSTVVNAGQLHLYNTIIAVESECIGVVTSGHHNLIEASGNSVCGLSDGVNDNIISTDARITETETTSHLVYFELAPGSPAMDAGDNAVCSAAPINNTSQNDMTRPIGKYCDIGSSEALPIVDPRATASTCFLDQCTHTAGGTYIPKGNPINTRTGGYDYSIVDISIPTSAGRLSFTRDYASQAISQSTTLSPGWTHNHATRLIMPDDPGGEEDAILFKLHSGNLFAFYENLDGTYRASPGLMASLVRQAGPPVRFVVTDAQQNSYIFDEDGIIQLYEDAIGNTWQYTYVGGRLDRVSADGGIHYLSLQYDSEGRIERVTDHKDRYVTYEYDLTTGNLTFVEDVLRQTWRYKYEDQPHLLTEVLAPDDSTIERTTYQNGRAWQQFEGNGNLVVELTYNADGTTTVKDSPNDTNPETLTYDWRGTLTAQEDNVSGKQEKHYHGLNFRPDLITDALENQTTLQWSTDGANLQYIQDALENKTFIHYDDPENPTGPTRIIDPLEYETRYFYEDDENFPTLPTRIEYPLSFNGGTTYIATDYEYYSPGSGASAGKIKLVTDALGYKTRYTYTSSGQIDTVTTNDETSSAQTTKYKYDDWGRVTWVKDPSGIITHNRYDAAGRLITSIYNVDPSMPDAENPPQNFVSGDNIYNLYTRYYYDARSNQIAIVDTDWTITRTYYDLADRAVSVVQNLVIDGTPANSEATVIAAIHANIPSYGSSHPDWNIRTDTEYDSLGNIIVTRDPQGIITRTYYDAANRPKLVIENWAGADLYGDISTAPSFNPGIPDQNVRTEYFYDLNSNLIATKDTLGVITRTYYDALNRPKTVVQHLTGQEISAVTPPARGAASNIRTDTYYDANGNVIATKDPRGVTTVTYYDALNRTIAVVQNMSVEPETELPDLEQVVCGSEINICSFTYYDQVGNVVATVDPRGVITRTYYDESNRPIATIQNWTGSDLYGDLATAPPYDPDFPDRNIRTTVVYDSNGYRDTTINPLGLVTKYEYNYAGQLVKTISNYSNSGVQQNDDDQRNIVTAYVYDVLGRRVQTTDTLGRVTLNTYDDLGRVTSVTQNHVQEQPQNYKDESGDRYNLVTTYIYDLSGNQIAVTDTAGVTTRTYYDALGRSVAVVRNLTGDPFTPFPPERTDPSENLRTDTIYLGNGSVDAVIDEMGAVTDYGYDALGRLVTTLDPLGKPTSFVYDASGNRTTMTDANGITTRYEYDAFGRLKVVWENYRAGVTPNQETNVRTEYTYDANGDRLSIRDGQSHLEGVDYRTTFTYDALGRLETETDPLGNATTYGYDALGNRVSLLDANGKTTIYRYDELNRLVLIDYPDPDANVTFDYDALGRRQSMQDSVGTTAWEYNNLNLPNSITDPFSASVSYDYDEVGNRTSLTYPDDRVVSYEYNDVHRLMAVTSNQLSVASYQYDAVGRVKMIERANGVSTLYNYYDNGWLQDITHSTESATLASYQYEYDHVGNRTQAIETLRGIQTGPTVTVLVAGSTGTLLEDKPVYVFNGDTYTGYSKLTDANGEAAITLPEGNYRFRVDVDGTQFWSGSQNHCDIPGCLSVVVTIPEPVLVTVQDTDGTPMAGLDVYAFDGTTYTGFHGATNENGQLKLRLPKGKYRFRADLNGTQFWSGTENHCTVPTCTMASVSVTPGVTVLVAGMDGAPKAGLNVYAFNENTYIGYSKVTDADGQAVFTLPQGSYRFRADLNGTQFWSGAANHCDVPGCRNTSIAVTNGVLVTVQDTDGTPQAGLQVYAFNGSTYTGYNGTTNENGQATFTLPLGSYRFRADLNGTQFWSGESNHCEIPGCGSASVTVSEPVIVTVLDTDGAPRAGLNVYAFNGSTYTGYSKTTNVDGQAVFALPLGSYRFRADLNGTQFWSGTENHCTLPGCGNAQVTVTIPITVMVRDGEGAPRSGVSVYAFDGNIYTGYSKVSDVNGQAVFTLPSGSYHFRADDAGSQYWSDSDNHCALPGCLTTSVTVGPAPAVSTETLTSTPEIPTPAEAPTQTGYQLSPIHYARGVQVAVGYQTLNDVTVTVLDTGNDPKEGLNVYVFDGVNYTGHTGTTDTNGQVTLTLPEGNYRFRADFNGTQFWSGESNHCSVQGCSTAGITVTLPVTVTVRDTYSAPKAGLDVYAFSGATYTGFHVLTDANGQAVFTLPQGNYRFRADLNGTQFWSSDEDICTLPGCPSVDITVTIPMTVKVMSWSGQAYSGLPVYVFDDSGYTGFNGVSDENGLVVFTLPVGSYRFRTDHEGVQYWSDPGSDCTVPGCMFQIIWIPGWEAWTTTQTIKYTYDPLNRLTGTNDLYGGYYYRYTYDAVGNRLTSEDGVSTSSYEYDDANRLIEVNDIPYTWDANGNLLSDSVNTYRYDTANRLTSFNDTATYSYNGLGDRLRQTINGETTQYTLDLNTGLTQVLEDETYSYTYGVGRISQQRLSLTDYFLGDALGSVRQLANAEGVVTSLKSYAPYGEMAYEAGEGFSPFGYTGEQTDPSGMQYLRARMYSPASGRFQTRDIWQGDYNRPLSLNRWMYTEGNPVNYTDPTGLIAQNEAADADKIVKELKIYNVFVKADWHSYDRWDTRTSTIQCDWYVGEWELSELKEIRKGVVDLSRAMGLNKFIFNLGYVNVIKKELWYKDGTRSYAPARGGLYIVQVNNIKHTLSRWGMVHELGHAWDAKYDWKLSDGLVELTTKLEPRTKPLHCGSDKGLPGCNNAGYVYGGVPPAGAGPKFNKLEDFAESVAAYVYFDKAQDKVQGYLGTDYEPYLYYPDYRGTPRWAYIRALIQTTTSYQQLYKE